MNIPQNWSKAKLIDLVANSGTAIKRGPFGGDIKKEIFVEDGFKVYEQRNAIYNDFETGDYYIDEVKYKELQAFAINPDDLIISCSGTIGKVAIVPPTAKPGIINQALMKITPNPKQVIPAFFKYLLETPYMQREMFGSASGSAIKNVKPLSDIKETNLILPPLKEQEHIVGILATADLLRQMRRYALQLSETYLQSVFLSMFGDPVTNPMGWETYKFGDVGKLERGLSKNRPRNAPELLGGPYPLIQTGDIANASGYITAYNQTYSELGLAQSKLWPKGTLCITIAANIAKTAVLTFKACFPDSVVGFIPNNNTNVEFIQYWLSFLQKNLEETAPESAQKNINLEILRNLYVPIPPLPLQEKFSMLVKQFEQLQTQQQEALRQADHLFHTLLHRAFRGEL